MRFLLPASYLAIAVIALVGLAISDFAPVALAGAAALALLVAVLAVRRDRARERAIRSISEAASAIAAGDFDRRIPPSGDGGSEAEAFNALAAGMQARIESAEARAELLSTALNSSPEAVMAVDAEYRIAFANEAAGRLFDRSTAELTGSPLVWVLADEKVVEVVRGGGRGEAQVIERHGKQHLRVHTAPVSLGSDWRALLFIQDLTESARTEQMRRDFVANVSHELRTPLASLKAVIDTLRAGAIQDEAASADFLARADGEVFRLVQMVEELLELSRIESGDLPLSVKPFAIESVVRSAVERLLPQAESRHIAIETDVPAGLPPVKGDPVRLERVIVNLVHNAVKFTPEGGFVRVSATASGEALTVRVHDTGVGIDAADVPRVFERFYKTDRARAGGGAGLGLAVVKHTVEAHGGTVAVESRPGKGSTFVVTIPAR